LIFLGKFTSQIYIRALNSKTTVKPTIPVNYDLEFEPNFKNFTFRGKECITINCFGSTDKIILNGAELKIKRCHVEIPHKILKPKLKLDAKKRRITNSLAAKN